MLTMGEVRGDNHFEVVYRWLLWQCSRSVTTASDAPVPSSNRNADIAKHMA